MKKDEAMTREDILDLALRHMINASRRHSGWTAKEEAKHFLQYVLTFDGRTSEARAFKKAVARRMSFVSE